MTDNLVEISKLIIPTVKIPRQHIPTQEELARLVNDFNRNESRANDFKQYALEYSKKNKLEKWWNGSLARDKMLEMLSVVGELQLLSNKLIALNIVLAQKLNFQSSQLDKQEKLILGKMLDNRSVMDNAVEIQKEILSKVEANKKDRVRSELIYLALGLASCSFGLAVYALLR